MSDFKCIAKTGNDFAVICFEKVAEEVETTVIEVFMDGMRLKAHLCDDSDTSLTLQPLPEGKYTYTVTQICNGQISKNDGSFSIKVLDQSLEYVNEMLKHIDEKMDKIQKELTSIHQVIPGQAFCTY